MSIACLLLILGGGNQSKETEFEVGQIWDIQYRSRSTLTSPHNEDILIDSKRFLRTQNNINSFLKANAPIWRGSPNDIFENKLLFTTGQSGYITSRVGIPNQSVGFWIPDTQLELTILSDKKHYFYFSDENGPRIYAFPYVGFTPVINTIPKDTIIRVSLARWWSPNPNTQEKRCYCQLSGWYSDTHVEAIPHRKSEILDDLPF